MRVKRGIVRKRRHNATKKLAKGFRGRRNNCFRLTKLAVEKALQYAYRDRKNRKREFRQLWIVRINAAARTVGLSYSVFMKGLKSAGIDLNRKALAELAVKDPAAFSAIAMQARDALELKKAA